MQHRHLLDRQIGSDWPDLSTPDALRAFRLANAAMESQARQRGKLFSPPNTAAPAWRPFQLAFILMNLRGVVDPAHADRERVVDGMAQAGAAGAGPTRKALSETIKKLSKRWFVLRNVHDDRGAVLIQPRWAITWMKGPMTRAELRRAVGGG